MLFNFIKVIFNTIIKIIYYEINKYFNKNNKILEFPKNYNFEKPEYDLLNQIPYNNSLVKTMINFLDKYNNNQKYIIVSLSGGVDSMVLISILYKLQQKYNYQLIAATIDYSLRKESKEEAAFTKSFCEKYGIIHYLRTIDGISRSENRTEFEQESKDIRYNLYKNLIDKYNSDMIFVAHHWDDITENVFTNFMRGRNMLDLSVMHQINNVNGVNIARPLLDHPKKDIYSLAHNYMIPYFLDTTPDWSNRGKMRRKIFPILKDMFGDSFRNNMNNMGDYSYQVGQILNNYVFQPFLKDIKKFKYGVSFEIKDKKDAPFVFWENIIMNVFHEMGYSKPSKKSIKIFMNALEEDKKEFYYSIKKEFIICIQDDKIYIFRYEPSNLDIKYDTKIEYDNNLNQKISLENFINGKIEYFIPNNSKINNNKLETINNKHLLRQINNFNLPNQILKNFELPVLEYTDGKIANLNHKKIIMTF